MNLKSIIFLISFLGLSAYSAHPECFALMSDKAAFSSLQKVSFSPVNGNSSEKFEAQVGNYNLTLMWPDDPKKPRVWDSPLIITDLSSGKFCETEALLITEIYNIGKNQMLVVLSYSLPHEYIHFIDMQSCNNKYPTLKFFTERIVVTNDRIIVFPGCELSTEGAAYNCSAGQVIAFDKDYRPIIMEEEAKELTKKVIGIEFKGVRKVLNPKTPNAALVP
jgi:hypothetical protein